MWNWIRNTFKEFVPKMISSNNSYENVKSLANSLKKKDMFVEWSGMVEHVCDFSNTGINDEQILGNLHNLMVTLNVDFNDRLSESDVKMVFEEGTKFMVPSQRAFKHGN
jgi:hypothetical protein